MVGAGANRKMTSNMVRRFVELTKIPWIESQMGKGVIDARTRPHLASTQHPSTDCQRVMFLISPGSISVQEGTA